MTREKAIQLIDEIASSYYPCDKKDALEMAIKVLEQELESTYKYGVLHKIAEFFQNWDGDETAKMEISVNDMREIADIFRKKARAERQLKEIKEQSYCNDAISRKYAIDKLKYGNNDMAWFGDAKTDLAVGEFLENLPPITPQESKTGHWIYEKRKRLMNETDEGAEYITDYWCKCSKCGGDFGYRKMKDAFCKYCGVKMIELQERSSEE